jgi:hypothetical protein
MKAWSWILLVGMVLLIKWISMYPAWIEAYYTYGVYPVISKTQRFLFGWIPFSAGDVFYAIVLLLFIGRIVRLFRAIFKKEFTWALLLKGIQQVIFFCLFVYVLFYLLWGLNYNRVGIAKQLDLTMKKYSVEELDTLTAVLQRRMNEYVVQAGAKGRDSLYKKRDLFRESGNAYDAAAGPFTFLHYSPKSIKPSIFSYVGNVMGFTGYYNPFTGEAQVNTTVPVFTQPFIACHEIGHQLGYGKENEANFAGFLACRMNPSAAFRYSVYFDMYSYAIGELYQKDSVAARHFLDSLHPLIKKDFKEERDFFNRYKNPIEPVISWIYSGYLKANRQPAGRETYSQVVAFLIAYEGRFGKESL